jgi:hypothetical protein
VKEAGGKVADFEGSGNPLFSQNIICSNSKNYNEFQKTVQKIMLAE